jgi:hypothetical protein
MVARARIMRSAISASMSAASISKHSSREVLGERSGFFGGLESDAHND